MIPNRTRRRLAIIGIAALVACLLTTVCASSAVAQPTSANNSTTTQDHWPGGNSSKGGNSGGLFGGGSLVPSINPVDMAKGQLKAIAGIFLGIGKAIANTVRDSVASIPAPGQPGNPQTWVNPQNGLWPGVYKAARWTTGLGTVVLMAGFGMSFYQSDPYKQRQAWKRVAIGLVMVATTWLIPPLILHAANEAAMSMVPDGAEFVKSNAKLAKLGVGIGAGAILGIIQTGTVGVGILILGLERALIYLTVFMWPLAWACKAHDGFVKSLGDTFVYLFGVVLATKLFQALVLRLLADLPWTSSALGALETFTLLTGGLVFALLILPKEMLSHANDAASVALGTSSSNQRKAGQYIEEAGDRVGHRAHETYKDYRSEGGDDGENWDQSGSSTFDVGDSAMQDNVNQDSIDNALNSDGGIDAQTAREERERADYELNQGREILQRYDD